MSSVEIFNFDKLWIFAPKANILKIKFVKTLLLDIFEYLHQNEMFCEFFVLKVSNNWIYLQKNLDFGPKLNLEKWKNYPIFGPKFEIH